MKWAIRAHLIIFLFYMISMPVYAMVHVVSAENVYADIAATIGGDHVVVNSILNNPAQDPHLFAMTPSTATMVLKADVIIYNGGHYDPWMLPLLNVEITHKAVILNVASLLQRSSVNNPHFWYDPTIPLLVAEKLATVYTTLDPNNQIYFDKKLQAFKHDYQLLQQQIDRIKKRYAGTHVIATEPVFNDMATALGFVMHGESLQISNMNDTPPDISALKQFEDDLKAKHVKLFIMNKQVNNPLTNRLKDMAIAEDIPVITVTELLPANTDYIHWMMSQLSSIETALNHNENTHDN